MVKAVMKLVGDDLQAPGAPPLRLIALSVDPWRDTPQSLAAAAAEIDASDNWDWVVASRADTPVLLSAFGLKPGPLEAHEASICWAISAPAVSGASLASPNPRR